MTRWPKKVRYLRPVTLRWSNRSERLGVVEAEDGGVRLIGPGYEACEPRKRRVSVRYAGAAGDGCFEDRWDSSRCCDSGG